MNRRSFFANLAAAAAPAALLSSLPARASVVRAVGEGRKNLPDVAVTSQEGKKYHFYTDLVKGKTILVNFFYADCNGICPRMTSNLLKIRTALGDRVGRDTFIYSISLKPEHDTPAVLKEYAGMFKAQPGWSFLTGKPDDVEHLRRSLGFTNLDPRLDKDTSQHIGNVRMGNEPLMLWAACPGMARPEFIAKSITWMIRKG